MSTGRAKPIGNPRAIDGRILEIRGARVLLEAVTRNLPRFPADFMFRLTSAEGANLKSQFAISSSHGGRRSTPRAFTEQGVAMLSSVLQSPQAIAVNVEVMRAFVRLRQQHGEHANLARKLDELERRFDQRFAVVFDAIRALQQPALAPRRPIGFRPPRSGRS